MFFKKRPDGTLLKVPGYTKMVSIMMPTRIESTIYMQETIVVDKAYKLMEEWNKDLPDGARRLTIMPILLAALARAVAARPKLNRFVSNFRHYQRNNISFSFVTKKTLTDDGKEVNLTIPFKPEDTLKDVFERFSEYVDLAKSSEGNKNEEDVDEFDKLPIFILRLIVWVIRFLDRRNWISAGMIKLLPFYCTAFITNVGSLKLNAPLHHNYEIGNVGIFVSLGKTEKEKYITKDNKISERRIIKVTYTFDDRIVDGIYAGRAMKIVKDLIENPEKLLKPANIAPKYLKELNLTEQGWKLWSIEK